MDYFSDFSFIIKLTVILFIIGVFENKPTFITNFNFVVKLILAIFLIYRFNKYRKDKIKFTELDRKVSYSAGVPQWVALGGGASAVATINGLSPTAGNIVIAGTSNQLTATSAGSTVTLSTPSVFTAPGSVTATTTVTATLGAITATNGNVVLGTAGNGIVVKAGTNARIGAATLTAGSSGSIANTSVTANTKIFTSVSALGTVTAPQAMLITKSAGVGFTITSADATDTSTVDWFMVESN